MGTWFGAKKVIVPVDGDYGDGELTDDDVEDWDEDGAVLVQFWVAEWEEDDAVEIETNSNGQLPLYVAKNVSKAITDVLAWAETKAGKKTIAKLRAKHQKPRPKQGSDG